MNKIINKKVIIINNNKILIKMRKNNKNRNNENKFCYLFIFFFFHFSFFSLLMYKLFFKDCLLNLIYFKCIFSNLNEKINKISFFFFEKFLR